MTSAVPPREVRVLADAAALALAAAEAWRAAAGAAVTGSGRFAVALAGGRTPERLYALLADPAAPFGGGLPWDRTHVFFGDERCVPPDHPDSNYRMARATLLDRVPIPPSQVHRIRGELDPDAAADAYERELRAFFAPAGPRHDLALLGLGADGHTASLFPGSPALDERERWVAAPLVPALGARRVTLTLPALAAAARVVFLVSGAAKRDALARALGPARAESAPPAARVAPRDGTVLWLVDRAAAGAPAP